MSVDRRQHADSCRGHAVARRVLDHVHGLVGQVQQFHLGLRVRRIRRHADARGEVNVQPFG